MYMRIHTHTHTDSRRAHSSERWGHPRAPRPARGERRVGRELRSQSMRSLRGRARVSRHHAAQRRRDSDVRRRQERLLGREPHQNRRQGEDGRPNALELLCILVLPSLFMMPIFFVALRRARRRCHRNGHRRRKQHRIQGPRSAFGDTEDASSCRMICPAPHN